MSPCLVNEACRMQYDPRVAFRGNTLPPTHYSIQNWFKEQEGRKRIVLGSLGWGFGIVLPLPFQTPAMQAIKLGVGRN